MWCTAVCNICTPTPPVSSLTLTWFSLLFNLFVYSFPFTTTLLIHMFWSILVFIAYCSMYKHNSCHSQLQVHMHTVVPSNKQNSYRHIDKQLLLLAIIEWERDIRSHVYTHTHALTHVCTGTERYWLDVRCVAGLTVGVILAWWWLFACVCVSVGWGWGWWVLLNVSDE